MENIAGRYQAATLPTNVIHKLLRMGGKTLPTSAILRGKVVFCKANKRGSVPMYMTERFAAARHEISRKIALRQITIIPKTRAKSATVSTIPQTVR